MGFAAAVPLVLRKARSAVGPVGFLMALDMSADASVKGAIQAGGGRPQVSEIATRAAQYRGIRRGVYAIYYRSARAKSRPASPTKWRRR